MRRKCTFFSTQNTVNVIILNNNTEFMRNGSSAALQKFVSLSFTNHKAYEKN